MSNTKPQNGSGAYYEFGDGAGTEVFAKLPGCRAIGEHGKVADLVNTTPIDAPDGEHEFMAVGPDAPDLTLELNDLTGNADQQAFLARCALYDEINMKVHLPNGRSGDFTIKTQGYKSMGAERGQEQKVTVPCKITKPVSTWTIT
jgi:hypothetical protein